MNIFWILFGISLIILSSGISLALIIKAGNHKTIDFPRLNDGYMDDSLFDDETEESIK